MKGELTMRIGIDLDGVIYDTENYYRAYAELFDISKKGNGAVRPKEINSQERYNWSEKDIAEYMENTMNFPLWVPHQPYAKEVLTKIKEDGHSIIIITKRGYLDSTEVKNTEIRLKKEPFPFDKIHYYKSSKAQVCIEEKVDLMIDDNEEHIHNISKVGIPCLHYRHIAGFAIRAQNVTEVHNWGEIYRYISNAKNKKRQ